MATVPMPSDVMEQASSDLTEQVSEEKTEQSENSISDNTDDDQQDSEGILPVGVPDSSSDRVPSKENRHGAGRDYRNDCTISFAAFGNEEYAILYIISH